LIQPWLSLAEYIRPDVYTVKIMLDTRHSQIQ
jgi:hypothetical protein